MDFERSDELKEIEKPDAEVESLGAGRSGEVVLVNHRERPFARKTFFSKGLAAIVHYLTSGAGNPYAWNDDAVLAAFHRRKVLCRLVQHWFGERLQVADALAAGWDEEKRAMVLDIEYSPGRPAALHQPCTKERDEEYDVQVDEIMRPLQQHLVEAGIDGLAWQAGKGNPVALDNFLVLESDEDEPRFGWIDLESGVPALFPLNPVSLFTFYLPASFRHGRPLFDDVDISRLRAYIDEHRQAIAESIGADEVEKLDEHVDQLEKHQDRWKSMPRIERQITEQLRAGDLTDSQASFYSERRARWKLRQMKRVVTAVLFTVFVALPRAVYRWFSGIDFSHFFRHVWHLVSSQEYRIETAHEYVEERIAEWEKRKQLSEDDAKSLRDEMQEDRSSDYVQDFGVHIGIKSVVTAFEFVGLPLLVALGILRPTTAGALLLFDGPITRGGYVILRSVQSALRLRPVPWVAFLFSLIPLVGIMAYPVQTIYSAAGKEKQVARFIIYDTFTRIGVRIPIWGGKDTMTEHFFNRMARRMVRLN